MLIRQMMLHPAIRCYLISSPTQRHSSRISHDFATPESRQDEGKGPLKQKLGQGAREACSLPPLHRQGIIILNLPLEAS